MAIRAQRNPPKSGMSQTDSRLAVAEREAVRCGAAGGGRRALRHRARGRRRSRSSARAAARDVAREAAREQQRDLVDAFCEQRVAEPADARARVEHEARAPGADLDAARVAADAGHLGLRRRDAPPNAPETQLHRHDWHPPGPANCGARAGVQRGACQSHASMETHISSALCAPRAPRRVGFAPRWCSASCDTRSPHPIGASRTGERLNTRAAM